jgi:acyl carrier protein
MAIEEAFELATSAEACEKWETVADAVHFAQVEIAKKQPAPAPH